MRSQASEKVLSLRPPENEANPAYLVLFFDRQRSWAWLTAQQLRLMFENERADEVKKAEPSKASMKKQVKVCRGAAARRMLGVVEASTMAHTAPHLLPARAVGCVQNGGTVCESHPGFSQPENEATLRPHGPAAVPIIATARSSAGALGLVSSFAPGVTSRRCGVCL